MLVTLERLINSLTHLKERYHLTGMELVTDTTVVSSETDPEHPFGTVLIRLEEPPASKDEKPQYGTLHIVPEKLGSKPN